MSRLSENWKVAAAVVKHIDDLYNTVFQLSPGVKEGTDFSGSYDMISKKKEEFQKDARCMGAAQAIQLPDDEQLQKANNLLTGRAGSPTSRRR